MTRAARTGRWIAAAAAALTLGFGASQALASPADPADGPQCRPGDCRNACKAAGAAGGSCVGGMCVCYIPA